MDATLDSHIGTRIKACILINVIVTKLECSVQVWEGNAKFVKQLKTERMMAAEKYEDAQARRETQQQRLPATYGI